MFEGAANCRVVGTDYTSKHHRFALMLQPPDGGPKFRVAFTDIAAYYFDTSNFSVIAAVCETPLTALISNNWQQILIADQSGLWPGLLPNNATAVSAMASRLGLRGYTITLDTGAYAWAISSDFALLGRRNRA